MNGRARYGTMDMIGLCEAAFTGREHPMDIWLVRRINGLVGKCFPFDVLMDFIARFGHMVFVLYGVWLWFGGSGQAVRKQRRTAALMALWGVAVSSLISWGIGKVWHRPRPFVREERIWNFTGHKASASFPSNHTMNSAVIVMTLFQEKMPGRWGMAAFAVILAVSRIFAGIHYATDLLGGAGIAAAVQLGLFRNRSVRALAVCLAALSFPAEAFVRSLRKR